jgi:hypothetical protein
MATYRKKPDLVEAVQFDWRAAQWPVGVIPWPDGVRPRDMSWGFIDTLEGRFHVQHGDWIITGIMGIARPCSPDIFEATYEAVASCPDRGGGMAYCPFCGRKNPAVTEVKAGPE